MDLTLEHVLEDLEYFVPHLPCLGQGKLEEEHADIALDLMSKGLVLSVLILKRDLRVILIE